MKAFFEHPPEHTFKQGDLVTCACHNRVAIIVHLYDDHEDVPMNMAKIWWISKPDKYSTNLWLHTIARLKKYELKLTEVESEVE